MLALMRSLCRLTTHHIAFGGPTALLALVATLLVATLLAAPAQAQFLELDPGTRVRLRAPSSVAGQFTGTVLARSTDSLTVARPNALPITLPLSALTALEVSRGKSHGHGAVNGALWGGGSFFLIGLVLPSTECPSGASAPNCVEISRAENAVFSAVGGAVTGALIGAILGKERWDRASFPLRVAVQPRSGRGTLLALSVNAR